MSDREKRLEAALRAALIQWASYAEIRGGVKIAIAARPEGKMWRKCNDLLLEEGKTS